MNSLPPLARPEEPSPEERNGIAHHLRLRLVELCKNEKFWFANGRYYIKSEWWRYKCMDSKTGQELAIVWWDQELLLKHTSGELEATGGNFTFQLIPRDWGKSNLHPDVIIHWFGFEWLIEYLSEWSIKLQKGGRVGEKIILGQREINEESLLYPHTITLRTKKGYEFSYWESESDFSFRDEWNDQIWYPDFSSIKQNTVMKRHGKEYVEASCVAFRWSEKIDQQSLLLLSRSNPNDKFTRHYLSCRQQKIAVSHLIGDRDAEIIFNSERWRVKLNAKWEIDLKQDRYFQVSVPRTFWYDLDTRKALDHEPV